MHLAHPASLQALHSNTSETDHAKLKQNRIKIPNWREAASWLFTSVAEDLNLG